jgi:hypothetical protein
MKRKNLQSALAKPRNPHALAARLRNAGAHSGPNPLREDRRKQKQQLRSALARSRNGLGED